jgi:asparagine synthase (glutamine-hydrolysing)
MTVFAGVFCLNSGQPVPEKLRMSIFRNLRRENSDSGRVYSYDSNGLFLVKWDSQAFSEPAWREASDGALCTLVGDPLLLANGVRVRREQQLDSLAPIGGSLDDVALAVCRGTFAIASFDAVGHSFQLATDAIGLRSVYYVVQDGYLIFATALRILEASQEVRKRLSLQGMAELNAFSFPLAERTPYEGLAVLRECQLLTATSTGLTIRNYYDWASNEQCAGTAEEAAAHVYETFKDAVRIRAGSDRRVYSFLSGGMDSRSIVANLIEMGREVVALNFSAHASQDQRYAQLLAAEAGPLCKLHCLQGGIFPNFSFLALAAKTSLEQQEATDVDRPQFIWSGDGGSVGLGHVYMDEHMVELAERGEMHAAVSHYFKRNRIAVSTGALARSAKSLLPKMLYDSVLAEIDRYQRADGGRRIYLFLLFNDQRRHLFKHFETIDQHGLELLTPFYDSTFLKAIAATPVRWGILHRLYAQFFEHLPGFAVRTPWQTYPGHVPCPLPRDDSASYQWSVHAAQQSDGSKERVIVAKDLLRAFDETLQPQVFSRSRIRIAAVLHALGLRDCKHLLGQLQTYRTHNSITRAPKATD